MKYVLEYIGVCTEMRSDETETRRLGESNRELVDGFGKR